MVTGSKPVLAAMKFQITRELIVEQIVEVEAETIDDAELVIDDTGNILNEYVHHSTVLFYDEVE
jgi:hypothetical protein